MATYESAADAIAQPAVGMTQMQNAATRMWVPFMILGFILVVAAFVIGIIVAQVTADYFTFSKDVREAAGAGTDIVDKKVFIESTTAWLPEFKFLGMGMILAGITFLLATILGNLRESGSTVQQALGVTVVVPKPPFVAQAFPVVMMLGMMVLITALILGIVQAVIAADYWDHSIANELNPAPAGSDLLSDLGTVQAMDRWLTPFKFVGLALLLSGIGLALATIIWTLRFQSRRLLDILAGRP